MLPDTPLGPSRPDSDVGTEGAGSGTDETEPTVRGDPPPPAGDDSPPPAGDDSPPPAGDDDVIDLTESRWGRSERDDAAADEEPRRADRRWGRRWRPKARLRQP